MAFSIDHLPVNMEALTEAEKAIGIKTGNKALSEGNCLISANRMAWEAVRKYQDERKTKRKSESCSPILMADNLKLNYDTAHFDENGMYHMQFSYLGEGGVQQKTLDSWVKTEQEHARGQAIILAVNHPFFTPISENPNPDKRAYGWLISQEKQAQFGYEAPIYLRGSEIWGVFELNTLGEQTIKNREYLYLSPGWFPKSENTLTKKKTDDTLFEVSFTNIPAQKNMMPVLPETLDEKNEEEISVKPDNAKDPKAVPVVQKPGEIAPEVEEIPEERLQDLCDTMKTVTEKIMTHSGLKGQKTSPIIRAKLKDVHAHLGGFLRPDNPPEQLCDSTKKEERTVEVTAEIKTLQEQLDKETASRAERDAKIKTLEEKIRGNEVNAWAESVIPDKIFKAESGKVTDFMMTLDEKQIPAFKAIIEAMPAIAKPSLRAKGHSQDVGEGDDKTKTAAELAGVKTMTKAEQFAEVKKRAEADPRWAKEPAIRTNILAEKENEIRKEQEVKK